jgi:hypothetical protein
MSGLLCRFILFGSSIQLHSSAGRKLLACKIENADPVSAWNFFFPREWCL